MTRVPKSNAAQLPAAEDFPHDSGRAKERLSGSKREFVDRIDGDVVTNVENTWTLVALHAVHVFRTRRLATANGAVIDRMRPRIAGLKFQSLREAALQGESQPVIGARPDIVFVVDRAKGIAARIVLIERAHAIAVDRVEGDRLGAQVY